MAKLTPSKQKMQQAHKFAAELQKRMGENLKAVFVCGSVAANMAVPKSDIDVVIVCRGNEHVKNAMAPLLSNARSLQLISKIRWFPIEEGPFKDINFRRAAGRMLLKGAIPVFGKEYAMQHPNSWRYPNAETIRGRYSGNPTMNERLAFKRRKTSRVPRIQRK